MNQTNLQSGQSATGRVYAAHPQYQNIEKPPVRYMKGYLFRGLELRIKSERLYLTPDAFNSSAQPGDLLLLVSGEGVSKVYRGKGRTKRRWKRLQDPQLIDLLQTALLLQ